jgi:hypothetical protein
VCILSHVKVCSLTTYHIRLAKFGEFPIGLYALKLTMGIQQWPAQMSPFWFIGRTTSLSQHLVEQGLQIDNHVEDIMGSISLGNPTRDNPTTSKIHISQ